MADEIKQGLYYRRNTKKMMMQMSLFFIYTLVSGVSCFNADGNANNETPVQPDGGFANSESNSPTDLSNGTAPVHPSGNTAVDSGVITDGQPQVPLYQQPGQLNPNRQSVTEEQLVHNPFHISEGQEQRPPEFQPPGQPRVLPTANPVLVRPLSTVGVRNSTTPLNIGQSSQSVTEGFPTNPPTSLRPSSAPSSRVPVQVGSGASPLRTDGPTETDSATIIAPTQPGLLRTLDVGSTRSTLPNAALSARTASPTEVSSRTAIPTEVGPSRTDVTTETDRVRIIASTEPGLEYTTNTVAIAPGSSRTAAPTEVSSRTAVPTEVSTRAAAPTEVSSRTAVPTEVSSRIAVPAEVSSRTAAPTEVSSRIAVPAEVSSRTAVPAELSSRTAVPTEVSPRTAAPTEVSSRIAVPAEVSSRTAALTESPQLQLTSPVEQESFHTTTQEFPFLGLTEASGSQRLPTAAVTNEPSTVGPTQLQGFSQNHRILQQAERTSPPTEGSHSGPVQGKTLDPHDNETLHQNRTTPIQAVSRVVPLQTINPTPASTWASSSTSEHSPLARSNETTTPQGSTPEIATSLAHADPSSVLTEGSLRPIFGYTHVVVTLSATRLQPSLVESSAESTLASSLKTAEKVSDKPATKTTSTPVFSQIMDGISPSPSVSMSEVVPTTAPTMTFPTESTSEMETPTMATTSQRTTSGTLSTTDAAAEESPIPTSESLEVTSAGNRSTIDMNLTLSRRDTSESLNYTNVLNNNETDGPELTTRPKTTLLKLLMSSLTPDSAKVTVPKLTVATDDIATSATDNETTTTSATTTASHSRTTTVSAPATPPPDSDPPLYIKVGLQMTWSDFCRSHNHFLRELVEITEIKAGKVIHTEQVIFLDDEKLQCRGAPVEVAENIMIRIYISDRDGQYNASLTEEVGQVIEAGFKSISNSHFKDKVKEVRLVRKHEAEQTQPSVEPVEPGVTIAIIIASVGGVCCVALLLLQLVLRRRHGRKMTSFVPGTRQFSIRSVDSIALNRVKSRPHSGFFNPGLDSGEVVYQSHPVNFAGLANFSADVEPLYEQFQLLPNDVPSLSDVPVGCEEKNRYTNVLPFPETRVRLSIISKDLTCDYINANYITGYKEKSRVYIATQAPLDCTIVDFWRMVWEQQSRAIIMLTPLEEHGLSKCAEYWPDTEGVDTKRLYGDYQVELKRKDIRPEYIVSTLVLKYMDRNLTREIKHLWFTNWPQSNNPDPVTLVKFIHQIRPFYEEYTSPVVVHCSPGTGRTGTLIAIDICMRMYEDTRTVDILKCVSEMRHERSGVVQTREQYALIYKALNEYAVQLSSPAPSKASSSISLHTL